MPTYEELWYRFGISEEFARKLYTEKEYIEQFEKMLGDEEPTWEYLYVFPTSVDFAVIAGWGVQEAIRELVQNALDATEDVRKVKLDIIENGYTFFVIENPSGKILFNRDITLGASKKKCYDRGMYGRGLKECASVILTQGGTLYIISHDVAYRFVSVPTREKEYIGVLLGRPKKPLWNKTRVILWSPYGDKKTYLEVINTILFDPKKFERCWTFNFNYSCMDKSGETLSKIIKVGIGYGGIEPSLYVRDLYVNKMKEAFGGDAIFSYNTPNIPLEESRRNVADRYEAQRMIESMYSVLNDEYPQILEQILDVVVDETTSKSFSIIRVRLKDYFESDILSWSPYSEKFVEKIVKRYNLSSEDTGIARTDEMFYWRPLIEHFNFRVVETDVSLQTTVLKHIGELIKDATKEDHERMKKARISPEDIDEDVVKELYKAGYDPRAIFMLSALFRFLKGILETKFYRLANVNNYITFAETKHSAGLTHMNDVFVRYQSVVDEEPDPRAMIEIILHEYAHVASGLAEDNTEAFVNTLQQLSAEVVYQLSVKSIHEKLAFAVSGYYHDPFVAYVKHKFFDSHAYASDIIDVISGVLDEHNFDRFRVVYDVADMLTVPACVYDYFSGSETYGVGNKSTFPYVIDIQEAVENVINEVRAYKTKPLTKPILMGVLIKRIVDNKTQGLLLILGLEPTIQYYVDFEALKKVLADTVDKLIKEDYVLAVRVDVFNPYEQRYYRYFTKKVNGSITKEGWW